MPTDATVTPEFGSHMLDTVAAQVREVYCQCRNRWHLEHERKATAWGSKPIPRYDGGEDGNGRTYANVWRQVAQFVLLHGLDPRRFVRAQFAIRDSKPVEPTHLTGPRALDVYDAEAERSRGDIARLFDFQRQQVLLEFNKLKPCRSRYGWADADVYRAVLGNALVSLSALFRFCLAESLGLTDLVDRFAEDAIVQYMADRAEYDEVWGRWVPEFLTDLADRLRNYAKAPVPVPLPQEEERGPTRAIIVD